MSAARPRTPGLRASALLALVATLIPGGCGETGDASTGASKPAATARESSTSAASAVAKPAPPAPPAPPAATAAESKGVEQRSGTTTNGAFVVSWVPVPDPIPFNESFKLLVTIARAGAPLVAERGARLELDATMPAHGHGMNRTPAVTARGDGTFVVDGMLFHMAGEWNLIFHVYVGTEYGQVILRVDLH
ncbi:MAG TPA: hypothetical protein VK824_08060 [Planctomycetota bacterium]|nr:hypothetical protein [Planctomycetota bacterium]